MSHTWTRLAATATAGSSTITLEEQVDWQVGDEIVLATTGHRHSQAESEVRLLSLQLFFFSQETFGLEMYFHKNMFEI